MRTGMYYVTAVALLLVTVPMYHYIFQRVRDLDPPGVSAARQAAQVHQFITRADLQPPALHMRLGYRCVGGVVIEVKGNAYTSVIGFDGRPRRCEGHKILSP